MPSVSKTDAAMLLLLLLLPQTCSQVLLTLDNLADRSQYINARNTFTELLAYGTIPVINENVSTGLLS
jgi:glutamate 5-kinase